MMNKYDLLSLVFLALAVSVVSLTIAKTKAFSVIRERIIAKSEWLGYLMSCPYCLSHWASFLVVAVYRPITVSSGILLFDLAVSAFVIIALATVFSWVIYNAYKGLTDISSQDYASLVEENEQLQSVLQQAKEKLIEQSEQIQELTEAQDVIVEE